MTNLRTIRVAKDFSDVPAGRYRGDGPFSGQAFREDHLQISLASGDRLLIELDGVEGYSSAFLEEAFGGLVRKGIATSAEVHARVQLMTSDRSVEQEIWEYIDRAKPER